MAHIFDNHFQRICNALEGIEKSLSTLAEDTKANKELRESNRVMFQELESKVEDLASDPFGLKAKQKE